MGLIERYKEKKRLEEERKRKEEEQRRKEEIQKIFTTLSTYGKIINWVAFGFLAFLTIMFVMETPPIEASSEDTIVYKLSLILPFSFYTVIAYLQLKHRDLLPLFKERSVPKSIIAWVIVFFIGMSFSIALDSLYSEDYQEQYAIYQQEQGELEAEELDKERTELEEERQKLDEERKQLEEEREQFEKEKQDIEQEAISTAMLNEIEKDAFSIQYFNVGQADAALVQCEGHYMLIDGGNKEDSSKMYSVLKANEIKKLDIVVATHVHEDHIGGIPGALNYAEADLILCPVKSYESEAFDDFKAVAKENGGIKVPKVGKRYLLGDAEVEILGVNSKKDDENNSSIILKITYEDTSFLFTGDAERDAEEVVIDSGKDLSATVLKVGHHGSDNATSYGFIREVMPQYAIISVGEANSYGHPNDATLETLGDAEVKVFRTDLQGDIVCASDGKNVTFTTDKEVSQKDVLLSPAAVQKIEAERQAALERERQQAEEIARQKAEAEKQAQVNAQKQQATAYKMTYIGNTNTGKFHYQSCSTLPKEKNRIYFNSREAAVNSGYDPCGRCHP